jgi:O-antigen ligase
MIRQSGLVSKKDVYLIVIHILFGFIAVAFPVFVPVLFVSVACLYLLKYSDNDSNKFQVLIFISYLTGLEILNRSISSSFLPYEIAKYIQIVLILINIIIARTWFNSFVGILIIILMLPSLILFPANLYKYFVFNSLGILTLGFVIAFTAYQKISIEHFTKILKAFLFPCITFVTLITLKTPVFSEIDFGLGASFETSGGFGSNQVATLLGGSICFLVIMLDQKYYIGNRLITLGLILYFTLRAFLTFSRGGVIGMVLSVFLSFIFFRKIKQSSVIKLVVVAAGLLIIFIVSNNITGGMLLLRYQGETTGTLSGARDKNIESLSSGRNNYAKVDMSMWVDNLILGVGPGNDQFLRFKYGLYDEGAPHTEATRLLAENGIFGLFINLLLLFWPVYIISRTPDRNMKFIKCMLFMFAYATTFHSAMRTGLTPLFYGLASMDINPVSPLLNNDKKI